MEKRATAKTRTRRRGHFQRAAQAKQAKPSPQLDLIDTILAQLAAWLDLKSLCPLLLLYKQESDQSHARNALVPEIYRPAIGRGHRYVPPKRTCTSPRPEALQQSDCILLKIVPL